MPLKNMKRVSVRLHLLMRTMLVLLICPITLQARTLTGVVISATDEEPLIGATVSVDGTKNATVTDLNGNFSISIEEGQTLKV